MFKTTEGLSFFAVTTSLLAKNRIANNMNQYGLKPTNSYDFINPTNLINFGRSSAMDTLGSRVGHLGQPDSSPSLAGAPIGTQAAMLGISKKASASESLSFCASETAALRVCMAKGVSSCDQEATILDGCLRSVSRVKGAITRSGLEFNDWFHQQVSDNHTKPFEHRPQDWRHQRANEEMSRTHRAQAGITRGRKPKTLATYAKHYKTDAYAKRSRLPMNK